MALPQSFAYGLVLIFANSVKLPCGKICDDFDEREESLLGSRKAGERAGNQRARGKKSKLLRNEVCETQ